jgi:alkylresorcinol/alkylpyrone synthase
MTAVSPMSPMSAVTAVSAAMTADPAPTGVRRPADAAVITGAGSAFPPARSQEALWDGFYAGRSGGDRWARRVFFSAGPTSRHVAVDPTVEDISAWSTGARMARYVDEALPLGQAAAGAALAAAGLAATDVGLLAVVTCTGYATPGVDIRLADRLGMGAGTQRLLIGHMGCYAALPGLGAVRDFVVARDRPALLLCLEVASLHVQPPGDATARRDLEQLVAHALFSDGAAAVVVEPRRARSAPEAGDRLSGLGPGLEVVDVAARTDVSTADHMTWDITDLGFRMGLSRRVPDVLARHVGPLVDELLSAHGLGVADVAHWAVHPGGPRILEVVGDRLGLDAAALDPSRAVLAAHGNCSSATVLLVIDEIRRTRTPAPGQWMVALAFGPGLTLYAALIRGVGERC